MVARNPYPLQAIAADPEQEDLLLKLLHRYYLYTADLNYTPYQTFGLLFQHAEFQHEFPTIQYRMDMLGEDKFNRRWKETFQDPEIWSPFFTQLAPNLGAKELKLVTKVLREERELLNIIAPGVKGLTRDDYPISDHTAIMLTNRIYLALMLNCDRGVYKTIRDDPQFIEYAYLRKNFKFFFDTDTILNFHKHAPFASPYTERSYTTEDLTLVYNCAWLYERAEYAANPPVPASMYAGSGISNEDAIRMIGDIELGFDEPSVLRDIFRLWFPRENMQGIDEETGTQLLARFFSPEHFSTMVRQLCLKPNGKISWKGVYTVRDIERYESKLYSYPTEGVRY